MKTAREIVSEIQSRIAFLDSFKMYSATQKLDELNSLLGWICAVPVTPPANTVRVRIACAVCPDGQWRAYGGHSYSDPESRDKVTGYDDEELFRWIEADLPIPQSATVE